MHHLLKTGTFLLGKTYSTSCIRCSSSEVKMMRAVCVDEPGGPETLQIQTIPRPEPGPGEVLVRVHATALNRADLLQRRGLYPPPPGESEILGLEVSGIVEKTGPGVKSMFKPSDRVMALLCGGGYAEFVNVPEDLLLFAPPNISISEAAAIPEAWLTAFQLLHFVAHVQEGEVVLIHAGASGVGSAAVQLVRLFKAVPLVTAGTQEKLALAKSLGAAQGFNYREEDYVAGVHQFTGGRGADVILDCIGGSCWEQNVSCLAVDGRWVLYGTLGGSTVNGDLLKRLLSKRGQLLCSLLRSRSLQYKSSLINAFSSLVLPHFSDPELLRPVIDCEFNLDQVCDAHLHMEANRNMGKIILNVIPKTTH
ncbi:quinone oxidoreductase PIG3 [Periophthalmus magnuspinnatus]|uniref:quinone oxidoreductase PIG3 n=1 Tax=Periophthalmus magnuspinnatus TaxID=409849 RepID=UPI00145B9451|nr:quinone oxidoreductase PIG3 [Periophthalmus magnuspinnatus]